MSATYYLIHSSFLVKTLIFEQIFQFSDPILAMDSHTATDGFLKFGIPDNFYSQKSYLRRWLSTKIILDQLLVVIFPSTAAKTVPIG